jgi:hypothetical protein
LASGVGKHRATRVVGFEIEFDSDRVAGRPWMQTETTYWALVFEPVDDGDEGQASVMLSNNRKRIKFELVRRT